MRLFTFVARLNLGSQQEPSPPAAMNVNELAAPRFGSVHQKNGNLKQNTNPKKKWPIFCQYGSQSRNEQIRSKQDGYSMERRKKRCVF